MVQVKATLSTQKIYVYSDADCRLPLGKGLILWQEMNQVSKSGRGSRAVCFFDISIRSIQCFNVDNLVGHWWVTHY